MAVKLYNSEYFQRGPRWYVAFSTVVVGVLLLSLFNNNLVGAVLLFFLLGGYFYYSISSNQDVSANVEKHALVLGKKTYARSMMRGYVLEIDKQTQKIKNIVFVFPKSHMIHSFKDEKENIKEFIVELNEYLPMLGDFEQSFLQKLVRAAKL